MSIENLTVSTEPNGTQAHSSIAAARRSFRWRSLPISLRCGLLMLGVQAVIAAMAHVLYPADPFEMAGMPFLSPGEDPLFPLGTDILGRDIAAGVVHGTRVSLLVGLAATAIATFVGTTVGLLAGYFGGWVDHALMRITELFQVIPHFLFAIVLISIMGSELSNIILAIGVTSWSMVARLVRAETLALRELDYVKLSIVMGGGHLRAIFRHILPNALPPVIVAASILAALAVLTEAGLAFFGMSDSNHVSWGGMIGASREAILSAPYMILIPGAAVVFAVTSLSLVGDGLSQLLREGRGS